MTNTATRNRRTDFTDLRKIKKRALDAMKRGDTYSKREEEPVKVDFNTSFNVFAADVAHEIRHLIYYRSDKGKMARALVRASGDLGKIHRLLAGNRMADGNPIRLTPIIFRRDARKAGDRWIMSIRFTSPGIIDIPEGPIIEPSPEVEEQVRCRKMREVIARGKAIADEIPGPRGKRIKKMLAIATKRGCPKNWDLWFYEPLSLGLYQRASDRARKEMIRQAGGWPPKSWRRFPFRRFLDKHDHSDDKLKIAMIFEHDRMWKGFTTITAWSVLDSDEPLQVFLKHALALNRDKNHLYSVIEVK